MGCFDSTCCVSGLAIKENNPVRFALVGHCGGLHRETPCYPAQTYCFWTPLTKSFYNDYGSIKWDKIEDSYAFNTIFNLLKDGMMPREENYRKVQLMNETTTEEYFAHILDRDVVYDPHRDRRYRLNEWQRLGAKPEEKPQFLGFINDPENLFIYLIHEWAYQYILKLSEATKELITQVNALSITAKERFEASSVFDHSVPELHWVIGDQGTFSSEIRILLNRLDKPIDRREEFNKAILDTALFTRNLFFIRKMIHPSHTIGAQHELYEELSDWTQLVADEANRLAKFDDEEDE
jgi:hypothetical protein